MISQSLAATSAEDDSENECGLFDDDVSVLDKSIGEIKLKITPDSTDCELPQIPQFHVFGKTYDMIIEKNDEGVAMMKRCEVIDKSFPFEGLYLLFQGVWYRKDAEWFRIRLKSDIKVLDDLIEFNDFGQSLRVQTNIGLANK